MSWNTENYLNKAKQYWEIANAEQRESDSFLLMLSFFIEHLVRATLTNQAPALNAASDTESILFASGLDTKKSAKTVDFSEAVGRLKRLCPSVSDTEVEGLMALVFARNIELHGDLNGFVELDGPTLLPTIFTLCIRLLESIGVDADRVFDPETAKQAQLVFSARQKDRQRRVKGLIDAHKERFFVLKEEEQALRRKEGTVSFASAVMTTGLHLKATHCPSCNCLSTLVGAPMGKSPPRLIEGDIVQEVRAVPTSFSCKSCELEIRGLDELLSAGFPHEFRSLDSLDPVEYLNIDPMEYVDAEEIAHEYHYEPEYMDE